MDEQEIPQAFKPTFASLPDAGKREIPGLDLSFSGSFISGSALLGLIGSTPCPRVRQASLLRVGNMDCSAWELGSY